MTAILDHLTAFAAGTIARSHAMPGAFYTDPALLEIEKEKVFRREWICIGHADEVKAPGDYFTTELVGEPLLVTRNAAGEVNVLSNVCRHRGNIVAEGAASGTSTSAPITPGVTTATATWRARP